MTPSVEVVTVPESPTATYVPFPNATLLNAFGVVPGRAYSQLSMGAARVCAGRIIENSRAHTAKTKEKIFLPGA